MNSWKWTLEDTDFFKGGDKQFRNWYNPGPGNYAENVCVYMFDGIWNPTYCSNTYIFICYDGRQNANASYVLVHQYKNWTEAQSYCREHHTDLVSIRNESENQEIQYFLQNNDYYSGWIGLYRTRSWSDQSNSTFSNWMSGQPYNAGYNNYCTAVSFTDSGSWTNKNCDNQLSFLCYSVSSLASSRQYHFISVNKTWSEAQRYCRENYTDLATIDNMDEMNSLMNTVNGSYNGSAWIGLYYDVNSWRWSLENNDFYQEGEREFRNWYNEPNNYGGNELCVYMNYAGKWLDSSCDNVLAFVCYNENNNTYIRINDKRNWADALRYCRENYTDLANVRNMTENQKILERTGGDVWIGLYRNRIWSNGQITKYQNWRSEILSSPGQPDNGAYTYDQQGDQQCTAVSLENLGRWTDENCLTNMPFVCYNRTCTQSSCRSHQYHFISVNKTWTEAQRYCRENYIDLATIDNMDEMNSLMNTVNGSYNGSAWIGLYDDMNSWRWSLGNTELGGGFKSWYVQQQVNWYGRSYCVYMSYYRGFWNEGFCSSQLNFICYDGRQNASANYVFVYQYKNWTEAQSYCREHHTDLVSIRNETENKRITSLIQNYDWVWIGLYRSRSWSDQSNSTFSNWRSGQPDNAAYSEDCTAVSFIDGKWTDENCDLSLPFFCYNVTVLGSSRQYHFISVNKSWTEAQRYCRENYTDLATIDNMNEMNSLMNTVNGSYNGSAWIGLYDDVNSWRWSLENNDFYQEGEKDFRNWYHEPDNLYGNELCVYMDNNGKWNDFSCDNNFPFVCYNGRENASQSYVFVPEGRTWTEAQRYCREFYTDLASMRNQTEYQQILNITRDNGLYVPGLWGAQHCTAVSGKYVGQWTDESCFAHLPFFCYGVVGLRLQVTSEENLSESQIEELVIIQKTRPNMQDPTESVTNPARDPFVELVQAVCESLLPTPPINPHLVPEDILHAARHANVSRYKYHCYYEYQVMPFGLSNSPAVFQGYMNKVFREYLNRFVVIYIDDILIYSSSLAEHQHHIKLVLEKLRVNQNHCPCPWKRNQRSTSLKKPFSPHQSWFILIQIFPSMLPPPESEPAEQNYDIENHELLAIKLALDEWRHWLEGANHQFGVITVHRNLKYLCKAKRLNLGQDRWALFFTRFNFMVIPIIWDIDKQINQEKYFIPLRQRPRMASSSWPNTYALNF
nr:C-type mannose receptor 2-like [Misgurnus anguillicaudatus]